MKKLFITHKRLLCAEDHIDTIHKQFTSNTNVIVGAKT